MNTWVGIGRATRMPEFKEGEHPYVRFTIAVDRKGEGADFLPCTAFGKTAESIYKWVKQGTKIAVEGRLQTDSYTDREGNKKSRWGVIVNSWEFAQSKTEGDDSVPDSMADDELPWNV